MYTDGIREYALLMTSFPKHNDFWMHQSFLFIIPQDTTGWIL